MHATLPLLQQGSFPDIKRNRLQTLQVNLGYRCNQSCLHCHVNAGPTRRENMTVETIDAVIHFLSHARLATLDLTGGAPELNPGFRRLVTAARELDMHIIDRCNLTVLLEPEQSGTAEFLAGNKVEIVASLPCYLKDNVDAQRGKGVYDNSIRVLRHLNALGYGADSSGLALNLMFNPQGPELPPPQPALERDYKKYLLEAFGIRFNRLLTLANMPIKRFGSMLVSKGGFDDYMQLLRNAHCDVNLDEVMCKSLLSVDWQGFTYDCDFNQLLDIPAHLNGKSRTHISDLTDADLEGCEIAVAEHCYGCTAGQGSGCSGAF
ncbi:MAG: arsenosugar biosynthesis radical SAM (seleno)protein ArsS [Pseudomonadota bacterium]